MHRIKLFLLLVLRLSLLIGVLSRFLGEVKRALGFLLLFWFWGMWWKLLDPSSIWDF